VHGLPQAVLLLDAESRVVFANRAAGVIFRPFANTLLAHKFAAIVGQRNLDHLLADLRDRPRVIELSLPAANRRGELRLKIKAARLSSDERGNIARQELARMLGVDPKTLRSRLRELSPTPLGVLAPERKHRVQI
jgi:nitrogen fixation/metabolism regulation signal transduction histidine kinase